MEGRISTLTEVWIYDLRIPGTLDRFNHERAGWGEDPEVEMLDEHHLLLIVRPGGAQRLT